MAIPGLYRRELPTPPAFEFASPYGKELFKEALEKGSMEGFFKLISYYQTQSEPAYCGLASLAMVLNALAIDPGRQWKAPWRWFDDSMLDCCEPLSKIMVDGISFGKVACLAHCNGSNVEAFRTNKSSLDDFRKHVISCSSSEDCHVISSYNRGTLQQTGTGHFSPIGGYHAGRDMVLILDVARFKYPPHWIPLTLLWEAMDTIDEATGQHRGFMVISRLQNAPSILYTMSCRHENWRALAKYLVNDVPHLLESEDIKDIQEVLSVVFKSPSTNFMELIKWVAEVRRHENGTTVLSEEEEGRLSMKEEVLQQVQETKLYKHVTTWLASDSSFCIGAAVLGGENALPEFAADVCCQGAQLLTGQSGFSSIKPCNDSAVKLLNAEGEKPATVVSGTVTNNGNQQGVDILVPLSQPKPSNFSSADPCNRWVMYPSACDVFTALLLALPQHTWSGLKDEKLRDEIYSLTATENLPSLLQQEVMHLQLQLHFLVTECDEPAAS